jgi:hypothetical protein
MLFPFRVARAATFHMGSVGFPIDIVFVEANGRIGRVVHAAQPGSRTRWSHPVCGAVVELAGGSCLSWGIDIGHRIQAAGGSYNLLRTLVEADAPPMGGGYYTKEPELPGGVKTPREDIPPEERFRHQRLIDEQPNAMDQPEEGWRQQFGYQPGEVEHVGPNVRMTAQVSVEDPGLFIGGLLDSMATWEQQGVPMVDWRRDVTSESKLSEKAIVTSEDLARWANAVDLPPAQRAALLDLMMTEEGQETLADGFVLAGLADQVEIKGNVLEMSRERRK